MNISLLGAPASGKGTQADILCQKFGLYHLQTGDITRRLAKTDPEIKKAYDQGKLIPAELITMHVINFLDKEKPNLKDILFEGFPRFISQYEALDSFLREKGDDLDGVITLDVGKEEAIKRISSRRICEKCGEPYNLITKKPKVSGVCDKCGGNLIQRTDDNEKSVEVRFEYYRNNTKELLDFLDKQGKLIHVNGERQIDEIAADLDKIVASIKKNDQN
jgi:adenylate kinase